MKRQLLSLVLIFSSIVCFATDHRVTSEEHDPNLNFKLLFKNQPTEFDRERLEVTSGKIPAWLTGTLVSETHSYKTARTTKRFSDF